MGEIVWLGRYPVKSMLGEDLTEASLGPDGVAGDRRFALVDAETGLVASAKNPRKWRDLLRMRAAYGADGSLRITGPDGTPVGALDEVAGRPVRLVEERPDGAALERLTPQTEPGAGTMTTNPLGAAFPGRTFVDFAPVHVVTTATLDALGADHRRFRPNVVVRMFDPAPFEENGWPGRALTTGDSVALRIVVPTPRCVVPTLPQGEDLPEDPGVIRTAARLNRVQVLDLGRLTCVGAYGAVAQEGTLRVGDLVHIDGPGVVGPA
ncbi:MOSC domain-containing protein [Dactylosporangium fulvum]|uniref:MOSC N-terminal beta barrel domain-containing protein n=1 Tax=Dactylosporangium fulvum TaxID=53359 RepID=A0ABY5WAP6_9ACTN|nr:MOSC N-terminal beta barrel domain-containing protein [Dactylosporangium fulvum]UWP86450.1 MOSC N-terminal beta barrel domain-containing protein [Dactylosporangium fulvum]